MERTASLLALLAAIAVSTGCRPDGCESGDPSFEVRIDLASVPGTPTQLQVEVDAGPQFRRSGRFALAGKVRDGRTSLLVVLGEAGREGFTARVVLEALDAGEKRLARAEGSFAGRGDACNHFALPLGGSPPADLGVD